MDERLSPVNSGERMEIAEDMGGRAKNATSVRMAKQIKMLTLQSKYLKKFAKNSKNALNKIHSSDDPLKELGPGISSYH